MSTKSRKLRFFSLFWDYASALSLIALLVLLWHLGKGPVKVNFLRPYIIQALTNETADYDLSVGSVNLEPRPCRRTAAHALISNMPSPQCKYIFV